MLFSFPMIEKLRQSRILMTIIIPMSLLILASLIFISLVVHEQHANHALVSQLNALQRQIMQISDEGLNSDNVKSSLSHISSDISKIKSEEALTTKSTEMSKVENQLEIINQAMEELKKLAVQNNNDKEFIDAKNLPFEVLSVDVISQQSFVSIQYDHHVTPLGVGDTIAGWQIVEADYGTNSAEFKNNQAQYVKVNLQG